jgi:hypothetical protein
LALTLLLLLLFLGSKETAFVGAAIILLLVTMTIPSVLWPAAIVWFKLSHVLSYISSRVILTLIFIFLVIPVGLIRQWIGIDRLMLKKFKKSKESVFVTRNLEYSLEDLRNPF